MIKQTIKKIIPSSIYNVLVKIYLYVSFLLDFYFFKKIDKTKRFSLKWRDRYPQLFDKTKETVFDAHYIYHPAWAVRIVKQINPKFHVDISSTLSFSSILSAFIPVHFYDYRPANLVLSNLKSEKADLLSLPFQDNSLESLSCMHTIEHIGLGRYGDPIDPNGDIKAINELKRVASKNGNIIFVVPVGKPRIMFNAHRIYSYEQIISYFSEFELKEFTLIPDNALEKGMIKNSSFKLVVDQKYGCGCFWFIKK